MKILASGHSKCHRYLRYLLLLDWRNATVERSLLPSIAAGLAFLWNMGSLIGMATAPAGDPLADMIIAGSFSVLSLLPAVLLHISLQSRPRFLWIAGYAVSGIAVVLHVGDLITTAPRFHYAAILLVTIGFAVLTTASVAQEAFSGPHDGGGKRLVGANPITDCVTANGGQGTVTSKLLKLPQGGYDAFPSKENEDHNPARVNPRYVLNLGIGTDNLFHSEGRRRYTASINIANLTNVVAVYNFLSTFSGTHFLQPRTVVAHIGLVF